jgi:hypothetical protein
LVLLFFRTSGKQKDAGFMWRESNGKRDGGVVVNLKLLQQPLHTLDVLHFLHENGPSGVTEIMEGLGLSAASFYAAARRLEELRLIYRREERGFPK